MRTLFLMFLVAVLGGCGSLHSSHSSGPQDTHTITRTTASGVVEGRPTLGSPIPIPGHPVVAVPFSIESRKGLFERDDPYRRGGYGHAPATAMAYEQESSRLGGSVRWHNVLFRDLQTGEEWMLLDGRGVIGSWQAVLVRKEKDGPWVSRAMVFIAVLGDTNGDGLLDDLDARVAILTDADGRHPRPISPTDAQAWSTDYDAEKDLFLLRIVADTNKDGRFDFEDIAAPHIVAAGATSLAQRIVSARTVERAGLFLAGATSGPEEAPPAAGE